MNPTRIITAVTPNDGLKNFIIGKLWVNSQDGSRPGSLRISRDLPSDIVLTPGVTLFLTPNRKREGKIDADYSVSILLPVATADHLIAQVNENIERRTNAEAIASEPVN